MAMKFEEKYNWGGWQNCLHLSNGEIDIVATTDIGPRIMRCGFEGQKNLLLELKDEMGKKGGDEFRLYGGSRIWHSPEANPRSYMPDNDPVEYKWNGKTLRLIQPVEAKTGMLKEMFITMSSSENKIEIVYRIYNKGIWPVKYALWALTLMANNGRAIIPQEPYQKWEDNLLPVRPLVLWSYSEMDDKRWAWGKKYIQLRQDPKSAGPTKVGLLNKLCWEAYTLDDFIFLKRYNFEPDAEYPDYMCNTEVYTDPKLFELETLSPLKVIEPGSFSEHKENWYLFKAEIGVDEDSIDKKLLPLLEKTEIP
jgi:hypothetical protein